MKMTDSTESRSLRERRLEVPWHLESGPEQQWGDSVAICYGTGGGQFCIMYKEDVAGNRALLEHLVDLHNRSLSSETSLSLTKGELEALIDFHDWNESGADAMGIPESAEYHRRRSEHFEALKGNLKDKK